MITSCYRKHNLSCSVNNHRPNNMSHCVEVHSMHTHNIIQRRRKTPFNEHHLVSTPPNVHAYPSGSALTRSQNDMMNSQSSYLFLGLVAFSAACKKSWQNEFLVKLLLDDAQISPSKDSSESSIDFAVEGPGKNGRTADTK